MWFLYFPVHGKKTTWNGLGKVRSFCFILIQTLPTFWAEWIFILRTFIFWFVWAPYFQNSRFPDFQISRFPDFQISGRRWRRRRRRKNSQIPTWPLSQRTQGSKTSQGAKSPCCDFFVVVAIFAMTFYQFRYWQPRKQNPTSRITIDWCEIVCFAWLAMVKHI